MNAATSRRTPTTPYGDTSKEYVVEAWYLNTSIFDKFVFGRPVAGTIPFDVFFLHILRHVFGFHIGTLSQNFSEDWHAIFQWLPHYFSSDSEKNSETIKEK